MYRLIFIATLLLSACHKRQYQQIATVNLQRKPDTIFGSCEDLSTQKFEALKKKYKLDTLFQNEQNELKRILLVRNWIHRTIKIDDHGSCAGDGSVEATLDESFKGNGFHCRYFTAVQNAILNAYGYVTRCLLIDTGMPVDYMVGGGHHAVNEVWLNNYHKWFLSDAKYDYHFEKKGIPLSALKITDEYLKNKAKDIALVTGPKKKIVAGLPEYNINTKEQLARVYTWISWDKYNNRYTSWPNSSADIVVYGDAYFHKHTWLWHGKPYWAYNTRYMHKVHDRNTLEWIPNIVIPEVTIQNEKVSIELSSSTANFKT